MRVLGIDQSLTCTGLAVIENGNFEVLDFIKPKSKGLERLDLIVSHCAELAAQVDVVAVEGPALSAKNSSSTGVLFGLFHALTLDLWRAGREPIVVNPSQRAAYATGKGNADKDQVLAAAIHRYGDDRLVNNNIADAAIIAAMAARLVGSPVAAEGNLSPQFTDVLTKVAMPGGLEQHLPDTMLEDRAWKAISDRVDLPTLKALQAMDDMTPAYATALLDYAKERGYVVHPNQRFRSCLRRLDQPSHSCGAKKCTTDWATPVSWQRTVLLRTADSSAWAILSQEASEHGLPAPIGGERRAHLHTTANELVGV